VPRLCFLRLRERYPIFCLAVRVPMRELDITMVMVTINLFVNC
jgi:hypothetical protein